MINANMWINGRSVDSENQIDVINPANGEAIGVCHFGNSADVDLAVKAARNAFTDWSILSDSERNNYLLEVAKAIESNMPKLMNSLTLESGKPLNGLNGVGSGMEVGASIAWTQATTSIEMPIEIIQDNDEARIELHRKPLGVVASITPWNWPLMIAIWHIMPALRSGNTVVLKPSPLTPLTTSYLVELANDILPKGVLNLVHGDAEVGNAITQHSDINKIIFTGSTRTGKTIMRDASGNLKRLTLELGGNDAGIVLPDVNVKEIAPKLFAAGFHNNGQTCACLKRLYVHESQYEEMCSELATLANNANVGNGLDEKTDLGPVQNAQQLAIVSELVDAARNNNARILSGGKKIGDKGYFYAPTIVADQTDGDSLVDEEQFGPVLPVIKYTDLDEVITRSNKNENGLGGSVWSSDLDQATRVAQQLECGTVWVNEHGAIQPDAPFGGIKQSGFGVEFGAHGLAEYTSLRTIKIMKG